MLCDFNVLEQLAQAFLLVSGQPPAPPNVGGFVGGGGAKVSALGSSARSSFLLGPLSVDAVAFFSFVLGDFFSPVLDLSGCSTRGCGWAGDPADGTDGVDAGVVRFSTAGIVRDGVGCSGG